LGWLGDDGWIDGKTNGRIKDARTHTYGWIDYWVDGAVVMTQSQHPSDGFPSGADAHELQRLHLPDSRHEGNGLDVSVRGAGERTRTHWHYAQATEEQRRHAATAHRVHIMLNGVVKPPRPRLQDAQIPNGRLDVLEHGPHCLRPLWRFRVCMHSGGAKSEETRRRACCTGTEAHQQRYPSTTTTGSHLESPHGNSSGGSGGCSSAAAAAEAEAEAAASVLPFEPAAAAAAAAAPEPPPPLAEEELEDEDDDEDDEEDEEDDEDEDEEDLANDDSFDDAEPTCAARLYLLTLRVDATSTKSVEWDLCDTKGACIKKTRSACVALRCVAAQRNKCSTG
jgi:hypothetical protein